MEAEYGEGVDLAPRAVLAPGGNSAQEIAGAEARPAAAATYDDPEDDPEYIGDEGVSEEYAYAPEDAGAYEDPEADPEYVGDEGASEEDADAAYLPADADEGPSGDAGGDADEFVDAGSVVPGKGQWEQERTVPADDY